MSEAAKNLLVLVDGSSYFYRAFHALPPLHNSKGEPTGAVYGVANMIRRLMKDYPTPYFAVVFDAKGKTFRDDLYDAYKANREAMPDDLTMQFEPLVQIIKGLGIPIIVEKGVEADDVIGTLSKKATALGMKTIISTGDKDMAQLVDPNVTLINTMNNVLLDEAGVKEKFGVAPNQVIDYLTLMGDKVDNIPGVEKVGPKTAAKWINTHGTLEAIMEDAHGVKGKVGENLRKSLNFLPLSKKLITIKTDVPLSVCPKDCKLQAASPEVLIPLLRQLEFRRWLNELLENHADENDAATHYEIITDEITFKRWLNKLKAAPLFAFDTETTDLNYIAAKIVGISFAVEVGSAAYVPLTHDYLGAPTQLNLAKVLSQLKPLLTDPKHKKVGQNLKYDMNVLMNYAIELKGGDFDTMLESYVFNSAGSRHDMDSLALKYLGKKTIHFEDVAGKGKKQLTFNKIPVEKAGPYAAEDADITLALHQTLMPKIEKLKGVMDVFTKIEMPLVPVLAAMERKGVLVDGDLLTAQSKRLGKQCEALEKKAFELAGGAFNLSSPKQLQAILYEKMGLPILQQTPKGQPSTAESVLKELALDYPLPALILEYRSLAKLKSTYTDKLPNQIQPKTDRVHTSYHQAVASTGRLSSSDPNLQNIPIRTEEGRRIRQAFIAPKDHLIISADYSQIELRLMAHLSDDAGLLKAFANGDDIHKATAAEVFDVSIQNVTDAQRRKAKAINFGLIYGMSAYGLARQIDVTPDAAKAYIDRYFARYPGVKIYMNAIKDFARKEGFVETIFGRRLYLPDIKAQNMQRRRGAERVAINAPMQGSAADIIKLAMIQVDAWLKKSTLKTKMIMQVHDELVFEAPKGEVEAVSRGIKTIMCEEVKLKVPLDVNIGAGHNWDEAH